MSKDAQFNKKWPKGLKGHFIKVDNIPKANTLLKRCWTLHHQQDEIAQKDAPHRRQNGPVMKTDNIFIRMWSCCNSYIGES